MQIKTKLYFNFMVLVISLILTGYIGIRATRHIHKSHLLAEKVTELLFIENKMILLTGEAITTSNLSQLQEVKRKFNQRSQSFNIVHEKIESIIDDNLYHELITNKKNIEITGKSILKIHEKKLTNQSIFGTNDRIETIQRTNIRSIIFNFKIHQLTRIMGNIQYFSKETLYQVSDKKHLYQWINGIKNLKILTSKLKPTVLSQIEKKQLLFKLDQYMKTAQIMGRLAIAEKNIEHKEAIQIIQLQKIIQKSEKISASLKAKIAQASKLLSNKILLTQVALMGVIVLCAFIFSTYISSSITTTIFNLKRGVEKVTKGHLETKIDVSTNDEFKNLVQSFNDMTGQLRQAQDSLEENNRNLEEKVSERTSELQQAVYGVQQANEQLQNLSLKLSKYLSPQVYQSIFSGKKDVKLESYRKNLTIFFSDIQGFTKITDSLESEALTSLLNSYLDEMSKIALRYGGTIDKFIGDAIMIFFGDPETKGAEEDAVACLSMAIEMREQMKHLRQQWSEQGVSNPLRIRIGINTGYCTVGNFGSEARLDYTIIGGQVNLASRLESHAKADQILISHETYGLVKDKVSCERKEEITVKGIAQPVQTYQVIGLRERVIKEVKELKKEFEGFKLSIDLNRTDKKQVLHTLKKAIEELD